MAVILVGACHDTSTPPRPAEHIDVTQPLALLPANSDFVVLLDIAALRRSSLWTKYGHDAIALLAPSFGECHYDPFSEISTVTAGFPAGDEAEGILVFRGLDRTKTLDCLRTSKTETNTSTTFDGDFVTLTNKSGHVNLITFIDGRTMVMQGSHHPTKDSLTAALRVGAPLRQNPAFAGVDRGLPRDTALSMVMLASSPSAAAMMKARLGVSASGLRFTVQVTDRVEVRGTLELASADDARTIAEAMRPRIEAAKNFFEHVDARAEGSAVRIEFSISEAQLRSIAGMVKTMLAADSGN